VYLSSMLVNAETELAPAGAFLRDTARSYADLSGADRIKARVTAGQLGTCKFLTGATRPDGQKYEDGLKDKEGLGEVGETSGTT
jgi:hypothetical protein